MQVLQRVIRGDYRFPQSVPVSPACKDLLSRILVVNPSERITIQGIQQHPWSALFPHAVSSCNVPIACMCRTVQHLPAPG